MSAAPQSRSGRFPALALVALTVTAAASGATAAALDLPSNAQITADNPSVTANMPIPTGPWRNGKVPGITPEGPVSMRAARIAAAGQATAEILAPLRRQLRNEGFEILFECAARACGGFDFRFALDTVREPAMHVDLGDFRFLSARRASGDRPELVGLLISRSGDDGYVQIMRSAGSAGPAAVSTQPGGDATAGAAGTPVKSTRGGGVVPAAETAAGLSLAPSGVGRLLEAQGRAILEDVDFGIGDADLGPEGSPMLGALADYLRSNPERSVTLVGHTDSQGGLNDNIALSKRRADAVRDWLIGKGVHADQLRSDGVGYLSPLASNLTTAGRDRNRRVEAILTSTR